MQHDFDLLLEYIDARIRELVGQELHRDTLHEAVATNELRDKLEKALLHGTDKERD